MMQRTRDQDMTLNSDNHVVSFSHSKNPNVLNAPRDYERGFELMGSAQRRLGTFCKSTTEKPHSKLQSFACANPQQSIAD